MGWGEGGEGVTEAAALADHRYITNGIETEFNLHVQRAPVTTYNAPRGYNAWPWLYTARCWHDTFVTKSYLTPPFAKVIQYSNNNLESFVAH